jgi:hypothetical protein
MGCTMRARAPGQSVRTTTGNRYTAGADQMAHGISEDDAAELARLGWRRLTAAVAQSVTMMVVTTKSETTVSSTIARNRPDPRIKTGTTIITTPRNPPEPAV